MSLPSHLSRALVLLALAASPAQTADVTEPPSFDQFIVIPLRVHVLLADDLPEIDCHLTDADLERIIGRVNTIWHVAGIHFGLESIVREQAALPLWFRAYRDLEPRRRLPLGLYQLLLPIESRRFEGLHVYYLHEFPVNGVYFGDDFALVQETSALRTVPGGIDEPIPRVTAHELGHALGLSHRQDRTNLLASGTTGTLLNQAEVSLARSKATRIAGALPIAELRKAVEASDDLERARMLRGWLDQIPGLENAQGEPAPSALLRNSK
ncbi:MAG: matrixin family metalloprotease [Isosphaeraceae bacterium]